MTTPGAYLFKRGGMPAYVGRSDTDVARRASASFAQGTYDSVYHVYPTTSARQAYLRECRLFHRHNPPDNSIHPAVPGGQYWRCPVLGCPWS